MRDSATMDMVRDAGALSSEMLLAFLDQSQDCIKVIEPDGSLGFMNRNGRCVMEVDDFCAIAGKQWTELWPQESQHLIEHSLAEARAGRSSRFEAYCPTAKGTAKYWDVAVSPVFDAAGKLYGVMSISRDVSERVAARDRLHELAIEMRHRLRNAYAVAGAIAMQSARGNDGHRAFATNLSQRFTLVAQTQARLLEADARPWQLAELVDMVVGSHNHESSRIEIGSLPDVVMDSGEALLVALVLGELATNSLKHGALRGDGRIQLAGDVAADRLRLTWDEPTVREGTSDAAPGHGSGMGMMERMTRTQRGSFTAEWSADRLIATLEISLGPDVF